MKNMARKQTQRVSIYSLYINTYINMFSICSYVVYEVLSKFVACRQSPTDRFAWFGNARF